MRWRQKGMDGRNALRLIQQGRVPALRHFELNEFGVLRFHFGKGGGAQDVGLRAANGQHPYAAQCLPEGPQGGGRGGRPARPPPPSPILILASPPPPPPLATAPPPGAPLTPKN